MTPMTVSVVWATRDAQEVVTLALPAGATIADALALSRLSEVYALDASALGFALQGRRATLATALCHGDRIDITRPLVADPKAARRRRAVASPLTPPALMRRPKTVR
jgi:putative ubiquitin-RnfH superfamily antitoxin RatB of RatAB toxin-antitoxin module